jgi:hypothetical protein
MAFVAGVRARIRVGLGSDAGPDSGRSRFRRCDHGMAVSAGVRAEADSAQAAVRAVAGGIEHAVGEMQVLVVVVDAHQLDAVADADAIEELGRAPDGARPPYGVAYQVRKRWWHR